MKKILAILTVLALTAPAQADGWRHHGGYYRGGNSNWVAPLIGGAIIGGVIANQYYRPAPPPSVVYVSPPPQTIPYNPPYGYHWENIADSNCNCYRTVLVPN
jgi:hypothetical protein